MRLLVYPLILALSVFVSFVLSPTVATGQTTAARNQSVAVPNSRRQGKQRPLKQSPGTVNVRPRVTASQPGIPTVKVIVDRKRVPLGDEVTFTLTPASVVLNPRYTVTIFFGDGNQQRVRQTEIVYLYKATGTYTYSILVKLADPLRAQDIPRVSLSANPTHVVSEDPVTFTAQLSQSYPNIRYRFVFGDKNQTDWQEQPVTTHAYKLPTRYLAYVDIGTRSNGGVKLLGGSVRQPIEVISRPPPPVSVTLSANPIPVAEKQPATFVARVDSSQPNIRYRFDFGDRSKSTAWQVSPRTTHTYSAAGNYPARVEIRVMSSRSGIQPATSNPLPIEVTAVKRDAKPSVDLTAVPQSVPAGLPVFFRATTASANSNTRYRFNFGDGSSGDWKEKPEDTHVYSLAGNYPAFVEIGSASNGQIDAMAASGRKRVQVVPIVPPPPETPTPTPPPPAPSPSPDASPSVPGRPSPTAEATSSTGSGGTSSPSPTISSSETGTPNSATESGPSNNWWKYLLAALILFGVYQGWKAFYAPRPTLVPNLDPGNSELGSESGPLGIDFQMELNRNVTDGQVAVNTDGGSLIKSERKSDD